MKRLLATTALLAALASPAFADVIIDNHLSGTGDNVVFDSLTGNLVLGSFNGQHQGTVDFTCLGGCGGFIGASNGNDIKIANTNDLKVQVFDVTNTVVLATATDVFSLKGSGDVTALVVANEVGGGFKTFTFDLGQLSLSSQSNWTLTAINGETINSFTLVDATGNITDFEHYRIDVAAVPAPIVGAGLPGLLAGCFALWGFAKRRRHLNA
jgi:hypothetical protein